MANLEPKFVHAIFQLLDYFTAQSRLSIFGKFLSILLKQIGFFAVHEILQYDQFSLIFLGSIIMNFINANWLLFLAVDL